MSCRWRLNLTCSTADIGWLSPRSCKQRNDHPNTFFKSGMCDDLFVLRSIAKSSRSWLTMRFQMLPLCPPRHNNLTILCPPRACSPPQQQKVTRPVAPNPMRQLRPHRASSICQSHKRALHPFPRHTRTFPRTIPCTRSPKNSTSPKRAGARTMMTKKKK